MNLYQIGKRFRIQIPSEERYYSEFTENTEGQEVEIVGCDPMYRFRPGGLYLMVVFVETGRQYNVREEELRPIKGILSSGERIL